MPQVDPQTSANWQRAEASSNFGTRKLRFYQILLNPNLGLSNNYLASNSTYYRVVQRLQSGMTENFDFDLAGVQRISFGGAELFYVGTPRLSLDMSLINPRVTSTVVGTEGNDIYIKGVDFKNRAYYGMPVQFNDNVGELNKGQTYYVTDWWQVNNMYSVINVSGTFTRGHYNTKEPGSTISTNVVIGLGDMSVGVNGGGYDPIDSTDIQPNYIQNNVDRGWDCLTIAIAVDTDSIIDCGLDPFCDYDNTVSAGILFAMYELFGISNSDDIQVNELVNEYGILNQYQLGPH